MGGDHSPPTPPPRLLSGTTFQPARPPSVHLSVHLSVRHLLTVRQCAQRKALPQPSGALHPGRVGRPSLLPWGTRSGPGMAVDAAEGFVGPAAAQTGSSPGPGTVAPQQPHAGRGPASGPSSRGCYWGPCCQLPALCPQGTQEAWPKRQVGPGGTPRCLGAGKGGMCGTGTPLSMCPALPALASLGAGPRPARHSRHSGPGARWPRHPGPALRADRVGRWVSSHPSPGSFGTRQDGGAPSRGEGLYARGTATGREKPTPPLGGGQPAGCWAGPVTKNGSFPPGPHFLSGTLRL